MREKIAKMKSRRKAPRGEFCVLSLCFIIMNGVYSSAEQTDERAPSAGAKSLAIPFDQSRWAPIIPGQTKCLNCGQDAKRWTMFGRSY